MNNVRLNDPLVEIEIRNLKAKIKKIEKEYEKLKKSIEIIEKVLVGA